MPEVGDVVGSYRLDEQIGVGGMGVVFRATHVRLGRESAVKILADELANDREYVSRFFHEAKVVNEIEHPNIIDVTDFIENEAPRRVAYIMELLRGPTLSAMLKTHRFSLSQALNVTAQLADGIRAVHALGVVHRDLKPDNLIMLVSEDSDFSRKPCLKILDFGIAKIHEASHKTATGMAMGTPAYMAPEQLAGEPVSSATDIYAIGEILYEMLAGRRLFSGPSTAVFRQKLTGELPTLAIPAGFRADRLGELVRACVAVAPADRPTLERLMSELELARKTAEAPIVVGAPIAAPTPGAPDGAAEPGVASADVEAPARTPVHMETAALNVPSRSRGAWPLAGALALLLGVGFVLVASPFGSGVEVESIQSHALPESKGKKPEVRSKAVAAPDAKAVAKPAPKPVSVRLASTPAGAEVRDASTSKMLGRTPLTIEVETGRTRRVVVSADEHLAAEFDVPAQPSHSVALKPVPRKPRARTVQPREERNKRVAQPSLPEAPAKKPKPEMIPAKQVEPVKAKPVESKPVKSKPVKSKPKETNPLQRDEIGEW